MSNEEREGGQDYRGGHRWINVAMSGMRMENLEDNPDVVYQVTYNGIGLRIMLDTPVNKPLPQRVRDRLIHQDFSRICNGGMTERNDRRLVFTIQNVRACNFHRVHAE